MEKSPLFTQYSKIKDAAPCTVLFYRLGDFYEVLGDCGARVAERLKLTLTRRVSIPMCGVPYHGIHKAAETLALLGEKVAIHGLPNNGETLYITATQPINPQNIP
jgi:DNA mismatch repair protein MutS